MLKKPDEKEKQAEIRKQLDLQFKKRYTVMKEAYDREKERIDASFLQSCRHFFEECKKKQEKEKKGTVFYVNFNYLRWAVLREEIELQITAYGEGYYLEEEISYEIWKPSRLTVCFQEDLKAFQAAARKKILGFSLPDYDKAREEYSNLYFFLLGFYCRKMAGQVAALESFRQLEKGEQCRFVFGAYREQGTAIYPRLEETAE